MSADRPGLFETDRHEPGTLRPVNNREWLDGFSAYERGEPIPWGDESSHKAGWLAARDEATVR